MEFTAEMIAGFLGGEIEGDRNAKVSTVAKIEEGSAGTLSFLANPKYEKYVYDSDSSVIIVNRDFEPARAVKATLVKVDDAYACFAKLLELYAANKPRKQGVSDRSQIAESATVGAGCYVGEFAVIGEKAMVGENCLVYPQVYVGDNVRIGSNVILYPGVKIYEDCVIGNNVIIHAGAVIGADGFGFAPQADGSYSKIPQLGNVVIEDDVEVGANTCVDRATMGSTVIRKGSKLDNLIQLAHNVVVGSNTVIASQVGVAGSAKIGDNCMIGGQAGLSGHLTIGNKVMIAPQSGISKSVPEGEKMMGAPAVSAMKHHRIFAAYKELPEMARKVRQLEKELEELKSRG